MDVLTIFERVLVECKGSVSTHSLDFVEWTSTKLKVAYSRAKESNSTLIQEVHVHNSPRSIDQDQEKKDETWVKDWR